MGSRTIYSSTTSPILNPPPLPPAIREMLDEIVGEQAAEDFADRGPACAVLRGQLRLDEVRARQVLPAGNRFLQAGVEALGAGAIGAGDAGLAWHCRTILSGESLGGNQSNERRTMSRKP